MILCILGSYYIRFNVAYLFSFNSIEILVNNRSCSSYSFKGLI